MNTHIGIYMIISNTGLGEFHEDMFDLLSKLRAIDLVRGVTIMEHWEDDGTPNHSIDVTFNMPKDVESWDFKAMIAERKRVVLDAYDKVARDDRARITRMGFTPIQGGKK